MQYLSSWKCSRTVHRIILWDREAEDYFNVILM